MTVLIIAGCVVLGLVVLAVKGMLANSKIGRPYNE